MQRRPSVCPGLVRRIVISRILQLGTFGPHDGREMPIIFQGRWSKVKVVESQCRKTLSAGYRINSKFQDQTTCFISVKKDI